jgi:hypothetical protein
MSKRKGKPWAGRQQHQSESLADKARLACRKAWWAEAPREKWGEVIAEQEPRHRAIGCGVPQTQRGLSE